MRKNRTEQFQAALARILRPVARAMIAHGVTLAAATEVLKQAFYDAAGDVSPGESKLTDSRISLLTGLHRKDVRRLKQQTSPSTKRSLLNACTLVISYWCTAQLYIDSKGKPLVLQRAADVQQPGFDDLVRDSRVDLPPATVLDALLREGAISIDSQTGAVQLVQEVFIANPDSEAMISAYEKNLHTHLLAATENLLSGDKDRRNFERAAHFSHLSEASIAELVEESERRSAQLLSELNRKAMELQNRDRNTAAAKGKFSIGAYVLGRHSKTGDDGDQTND